MKKSILYSAFALVVWAALGKTDKPASVISGSVLPADGTESITAISANDSVRAVIINTGSFTASVKGGSYKLVVDAKSPYKDLVLDLDVKPDQPLDVGQIVLQK